MRPSDPRYAQHIQELANQWTPEPEPEPEPSRPPRGPDGFLFERSIIDALLPGWEGSTAKLYAVLRRWVGPDMQDQMYTIEAARRAGIDRHTAAEAEFTLTEQGLMVRFISGNGDPYADSAYELRHYSNNPTGPKVENVMIDSIWPTLPGTAAKYLIVAKRNAVFPNATGHASRKLLAEFAGIHRHSARKAEEILTRIGLLERVSRDTYRMRWCGGNNVDEAYDERVAAEA